MVSSILTGFGLAALVQLATGEARNEPTMQWTTGLWVVSSLLLLTVMVSSEVLRRREMGGGQLRFSAEEDDQLWKRSEWLLFGFALALLGTAAGVVLLGFYFSVAHGIAGCVTVLVGFALIRKMW
jgi:hypothetical protein